LQNEHGVCGEECDDFWYPDPETNYTTCTQCPIDEENSWKTIRDVFGNCVECPNYEHADLSNTECVKPECTKREIVNVKGEYEACPEHTKPDASCHFCENVECEFPNQIILPDGNCSTCSDYTHPSTDGKTCVECGGLKPGPNDIVRKDGTCCNCQLEMGTDGACEE